MASSGLTLTITTSMTPPFRLGDVVVIKVPERRWWVRLWYFMTFRRAPARVSRQRVSGMGLTSFSIEGSHMGKGIDLARPDAPEHAAALDDLKDQLLIVLVKRLGGKVDLPVAEIDDTGNDVLAFNVVDRIFHFVVQKKQ